MKEYLKKLPQDTQKILAVAGDIADKNNMRAYLVGGCVRDLILGVGTLDLDIAVEGDGIKFAEVLLKLISPAFKQQDMSGPKLICHRSFCTATFEAYPKLKVDIASARKEYYPQPASLPLVIKGKLIDDLYRRDFTINAMAINISKPDFGKLIDLFHGINDLSHCKIRILHKQSFVDDPTRILRAVRFEKRYGFKIEPATLRLLKDALRNKMLDMVQPQRLRDELILILKENSPLKPLKRLHELSGFAFISPNLQISKKTNDLFRAIKKEIAWFEKNYNHRRKLDAWLVYFMGLTDPLDINALRQICDRFVFRKGEEKRILSAKQIIPRVATKLIQRKIKPAQIFCLLEPLSYEAIILLKAKCRNPRAKRHIENFFQIYHGTRIQINGDDLRRSGVMPGPRYKQIFNKVLKAKLNGLVRTRDEELALMRRLAKIK